MADNIHEVGGIATVEHGETRVKIQVLCVAPQQPVGHRMKSPRPGQQVGGHGRLPAAPQSFANDGFDTTVHFLGRAPGKRQQEDAFRLYTLDNQVGNAVRQGHRLAGTGAGDHQQRPGVEAAFLAAFPVGCCLSLCRIQSIQVVGPD